MPIRIEDRCPSCESWLDNLDEELGDEVWRSKKGFKCPHCSADLVVKRYLFWLNPLALIVCFVSFTLGAICKFELFCTPIQNYLETLGKLGFIIFIVTNCIQNLKLKNTSTS